MKITRLACSVIAKDPTSRIPGTTAIQPSHMPQKGHWTTDAKPYDYVNPLKVVFLKARCAGKTQVMLDFHSQCEIERSL